MRLRELYHRPEPTISFEYFPPKTPEAEKTLVETTTPGLLALKPAFISITYGAGGGTRDSTLRIATKLRNDYGVEPLMHFTCVGSTQEQLSAYLDEARSLGLENVLALRGDPPKGQTAFQATEGGFSYATDLVRFIKSRGDYCIAAACYPEGHVEARFKHKDWDHAAEKVHLGAEFLITQLFYDWSDYFDMVDYLKKWHGVHVPIIPGILPFLGVEQIKRFTTLCGSKLPLPLKQMLEAHSTDEEAVRQIGIDVCTELCRKLLEGGVPGFHFYCLNRVPSVMQIMKNLGLAPNLPDEPPPEMHLGETGGPPPVAAEPTAVEATAVEPTAVEPTPVESTSVEPTPTMVGDVAAATASPETAPEASPSPEAAVPSVNASPRKPRSPKKARKAVAPKKKAAPKISVKKKPAAKPAKAAKKKLPPRKGR